MTKRHSMQLQYENDLPEKQREPYSITVMPEGKVIFCSPGKDLFSALTEGGICVNGACGGAGTCGKCAVEVLSGDVSPVSDNERIFLTAPSEGKRASHCRLACSAIPLGNVTVKIPSPPEGKKKREFLLNTPKVTHVTSGASKLAVDVGTTTVEAALIDAETGKVLASRSEINPQTRLGMDVLSRISYAMRHPDGVSLLQKEIVDLIGAMAKDMCQATRVNPFSIGAVAVAGNCAMLHLFLGINPASLGAFPFTPVFVQGQDLSATDIGLRAVGENARLYCLPSVSAFVGGDIVAGVYASGLTQQKGNTLFIDIGTNGEMVLSKETEFLGCSPETFVPEKPASATITKKALVSCSCAAGPALEGMNISCGMRAAAGAIEDIFIDENEGAVQLKTIDGEPPVGLCGSGVLAAIKEFLRVGLVRTDGSMAAAEELSSRRLAALCREGKSGLSIALNEGVFVTQKDVRQVQLAKGALLSGIRALLGQAGLQASDVNKVYVAGQFGAHLSTESLTECGILPYEFGGKIEYIGNSSLSGARMALTSPFVRKEMEILARSIASLELSAMPGYSDLFMQCLNFPTNSEKGH